MGTGLKFAIVVARFNDLVTKLLLEGAKGTLERHGVPAADVDVSACSVSFPPPSRHVALLSSMRCAKKPCPIHATD